ncbi:MAG: DNA mismatch repair protein MutS [Akkermansiaceae bacterium]|nr:DNA mismatch repair protein MutS [Akkermansiaceae bacterium]MDP4721506.1 DNA mismatch repair protein MutS [Akkermansiaceae bacterium]MDP4780019.1 DNA mismatch repair protein MutS [Akkermansiaceae bacterium]MDP4847055.1 DNA mismatch repair protein MutS [Akkermansiaceae bacterium]MDP4897240.1 DNA mismatch repair protein MutS [Akkermansiaceae bacterium]
MSAQTPMMAQYLAMRKSLPADIILFYRLGDFYEMFFEDAKNAAPIMNVALTKRGGTPMCGVPYHAAQNYIARLLKAGKRVAIAEQTSTPVPGKLVEREIARILSPGSIDDLTLLDDERPNYLAALSKIKNNYGLAAIDHTTGEFIIAEFTDPAQLLDELARISPSEIIIPDHQISDFSENHPNALPYDGYTFLPEHAVDLLKSHFNIHSLDGFGCADLHAASAAAGAALHYLATQLRRPCEHLNPPRLLENDKHVLIDAASQRNLDLIESRSGKNHTLLAVLDRTQTPMGGRLLRNWLLHPLRDLETLTARQNTIASLLAEPFLLSKARESLKNIRDIERTTSRLSQNSGNPRDLQSLSTSLQQIPALSADLTSLFKSTINNHQSSVVSRLHPLPQLTTLLESALSDEPPTNLKDGNIIRDGYSEALDELRSAARGGKDWIARLQEDERKRTGIDSLKIKFNNVFGYFIEVTTRNLDKVPDDYTRKQTMANAERYITPALKEMENKVLGAEERSKQLEYELFLQLRQKVVEHLAELKETAAAIAEIDTLCALAETAQLHRHCRPTLTHGTELIIQNGRHPVLEQTLTDTKFVPNDTELLPESSRLQILTGPNMAGKSTYIRQLALITLMAQIGAYVPADSATIGLTDRIFCRVGASDDLSRGQSTFMVEMSETALILNHATEKSLVILDEIGRGTATFDGLSIAWSVAEHLHDTIKCRTLFATHYHELTDLANTRDAVVNCNVAVREWNEEIIFLHKILPGSADKSYGIQVARLAGLPKPVLDRAKAILSHLEMNSSKPDAKEKHPKPKTTKLEDTLPEANSPQMNLFDF